MNITIYCTKLAKDDKIHVGEQLLVICRGKLAARNKENIPTFSLFQELEEKGFLSLDRLNVLKAMLSGHPTAIFGKISVRKTI